MGKRKQKEVSAIRRPNEKGARAARPAQPSSPRTEIQRRGSLPARRWTDLDLDRDAVFSYLVDLGQESIGEESGADPNSDAWQNRVGELAYLIALLTIGRGRGRRDRIPAHMLRIMQTAAIAFGPKATIRLIAMRLRDDLINLLPEFRRRGRKSRRDPPGIINRIIFGRPDPRKVNLFAGRIKADNPTLSDKAALLKALDHFRLNGRDFSIDDIEYYQRRFSDSKKK